MAQTGEWQVSAEYAETIRGSAVEDAFSGGDRGRTRWLSGRP